MIQPGASVYTQGFGSRPENVEVPHYDVRAPTATDTRYPLGKIWVWEGVASYQLINITSSPTGTSSVWAPLASISSTVTGTTAGTINNRSGIVTITTPSIAAGATFTFTITNSNVTSASTQILYSLSGGTTGSALTIKSVTNSANTSVVVLENGTGATTNVASLQLTFLVLN